MAATVEKLAEEALTLSDQERAKLAHALLKSLDAAKEEGADAAWEAEIEKRVGRIKEGTAKGRPADELFRDIRARYQ